MLKNMCIGRLPFGAIPDKLIEPLISIQMTSKSLHFQLTPREIEILILLAEGQTCRKISEVFNIAQSTVVTHVEKMKKKCGVRNTVKLIHITSKLGII